MVSAGKVKSFFGIALLFLVLIGLLQFTMQKTHAASDQGGAQQVTLNPGGGVLTDGSDGLRFTINSDFNSTGYDSANTGQDGVVYRGTRQYCCGAGAPMLNIGGTLYGQAGPAFSTASWTSIEIISTSGSAAVGARTSTTGNATAVVRYTATKNSLIYTMTRTVSYTYPNDFVTDSYSFEIPTGNTDNVKFYLGGDTAPGSSDQGYGIMLTSPVRSVISLNTSSQIMFGFREVLGSKAFDGATSQSFSAPYTTVQAGNDIGFVATASNHDAGLMVQWNLGSTPGTQTARLEQFATQQGTNLSATFAISSSAVDTPVDVNVSVVNSLLTSVTNAAFTLTLPANLVIATGAQTNTCGGTVTAIAGSGTISLASGAVAATANCVLSVPVRSAVAGTYTLTPASATGLTSVTNNLGTSSLVLTDDNDNDGVTNAIENSAPNGGDANNDGTLDAQQLFVTSKVNPVTNQYASLSVNAACSIASNTIKRSSQLAADANYSYPLGLMDFTVNCGTPGFTTTVTQYFYNPSSATFVLRKFSNGTYRTVNGASITSSAIGGVPVLIVSYSVTDGGQLDNDGLANGVIVDPAGPAVAGITTPAVGVPNTGIPFENTKQAYVFMLLGLGLCVSTIIYRRTAKE